MDVFKIMDEAFGELFNDGLYSYNGYCPICGQEYEITWDETDPRCPVCDVPLVEVSSGSDKHEE